MRTREPRWAAWRRAGAWASPVPWLLLLLGLLAGALGGWELASTRAGVGLAATALGPDATGRVELRLPEVPGRILAVRVRVAPEAGEPGWLLLETGPGQPSEAWRRRVLPGVNRLLWELPEGTAGALRIRGLTPGLGASEGGAAPLPNLPPKLRGESPRSERTSDPGAEGQSTRAAQRDSDGRLVWRVEAAQLFPGVGPGVLAPLSGLLLALGLGLAVLLVAAARARPRSPTGWSLALAVVLVLGAGLRLYSLSAQGFWLDEVLTWIGAQSLTWLLYTPQVFEHPPFHYLVVWGVRFLAESEAAIRLPFVAFGVASLWGTAWLGRLLIGPGVGLVAAGLLALAPFHVNYSQTARPYAIVVCLTAVALAALWEALERNRLLAWLGFVAAGGLLGYTHYLGLVVVALTALVSVAWPSRWRESALALGAIGLLYAPWLPIARRQWGLEHGAGSVGVADLWAFVETTLLPDLIGDHRLAWAGLAAAAAGLWASRRRPRLLALFLAWLGGPFLAIWALQPAHFLTGRHLIFLLPVFACLVGAGVVVLGGWAGAGLLRLAWPLPGWPPGGRWSQAAAVAGVFLLAAAPSVAGLRAYYEIRRGPDWREVARVLQEAVQEGDRVQVTEGAYYPLRHYYGEQVATLNLETLRRVIRRAPPGQRVWVLYQEEAGSAAALTAWLDRHGELYQRFPSSWSLKESRLYLLRPAPARR